MVHFVKIVFLGTSNTQYLTFMISKIRKTIISNEETLLARYLYPVKLVINIELSQNVMNLSITQYHKGESL